MSEANSTSRNGHYHPEFDDIPDFLLPDELLPERPESQGLTELQKVSERHVSPGSTVISERPCEPWDSVSPETLKDLEGPETLGVCDSDSPGTLAEASMEAVRRSLPVRPVETERSFQRAVFGLARHLKSVDGLRDAPASAAREWVEWWFRHAGHLLGGRDFPTVFGRFIGSWERVKKPAGDDVVSLAWVAIQGHPLPAEASRYGDSPIGLLAALCLRIQVSNESAGGDSFALSGYVAATYLGASQRTVADWLRVLVADGVLEVVADGGNFKDGRRMAREYRWIGSRE